MIDIQYKKAEANDIPAIIKAGTELFDYNPEEGRTIEFLKDNRNLMFLAFSGKNLIGMASGLTYIHPDKDTALFINEVSVVESFQNQGIGRKLVKCLVDYGKEQTYSEIWIATESSNTPAIKAYLAAGGIIDPEPVTLITF